MCSIHYKDNFLASRGLFRAASFNNIYIFTLVTKRFSGVFNQISIVSISEGSLQQGETHLSIFLVGE